MVLVLLGAVVVESLPTHHSQRLRQKLHPSRHQHEGFRFRAGTAVQGGDVDCKVSGTHYQVSPTVFYWDYKQTKAGKFLLELEYKDSTVATTVGQLFTEGSKRLKVSPETLDGQFTFINKAAAHNTKSFGLWQAMACGRATKVHWGVVLARMETTFTATEEKGGGRFTGKPMYWIGGADNADSGEHTELITLNALKDFMTAVVVKGAKITKIDLAFVLQKPPCTISGNNCDKLINDLKFSATETGDGEKTPNIKHVLSFFPGAKPPNDDDFWKKEEKEDKKK